MFKIYSSSAGSGKTYTLTKEYLKLVLAPGRPVGYFAHVLAITFTNAAANEMKSRILERLQDIAGDVDVPLLDELVTELTGHHPTTDPFRIARQEMRQQARQVFETLLHDYSNFSVTTIDSFTQRVVAAFTDELGLPFSFEVEMDTDEVLELAVDNLIERAGADQMDEITGILTQYWRETAEDGKSWNELPKLLREFGKHLTSDQLYEQINAVQELAPGAIGAIRQRMRDHNRLFQNEVVALAQSAVDAIAGASLTQDDFKHKKNSVATFFRTICTDNWQKESTATHQKQIAGDWGKLVTADLSAHLSDCFAQIETLRAERQTQAALYTVLLPHLHKLALLKQIRTEFDDLLRKDGRVHISEFNKRILQIVATEPVPFIYERLGNKYNHILIDEFQDTSRLQLANLLPLLENALAAGHFNLIVGDGKQAIYRFRGGDMDQIVALHSGNLDALKQLHGVDSLSAERIDTLGTYLDPALLNTNWRSAEPIVRFNNQFFEFLARHFEGEYGRIADVFDARQQFHQVASPKARPDGHVQLDFVEKPPKGDTEPESDGRSGTDSATTGDDAGDLTRVMLDKTIQHLRQALTDGYTYGDIAILCRKKKQARAIASELNALGIPVVSADSLSLQYADSVRLLVALMHLLLCPDQKLVRYEVLYGFCRVVRNLPLDDRLTAELRTVAETPDVMAVYAYLATGGFALTPEALRPLNAYELAEKLTQGFALYDRTADAPFVYRFLDEVLTFSQKQSGHVADFLLYWESAQEKVSVTDAGTKNAVSIQTIHKSKGLEYPVVIIPFANWNVEPMGDLWLDLSPVDAALLQYESPGQDGLPGAISQLRHAPAKLNGGLKKLPDGLREQHEEEVTRSFLESLNMLYVALTRPTDRLYIIGQQLAWKNARSQKTISYWLYQYLNSDYARQCGFGWVDGQLSYEIALCGASFVHRKPETESELIVIDTVQSGHRGQEMQLRRQAERVFDVQTFERTRDRDRKLVAALTLMRGPEHLDRALTQLVSEGLVRRVEYDDLRPVLYRLVTHPDLADVFNASLRADTERSVLQGRVVTGAPHRVVYFPDGRVVLVQYQLREETTDSDPISSLRYFKHLYETMGYPAVEGRLVQFGEPPRVIRLEAV